MRRLTRRLRSWRSVRLSELRGVYEAGLLILLGLGVVLPLFLMPGRENAPRLGDFSLAAALPLVVLQWRRLGPTARAAGPAAAFVLLGTALFQAAAYGQRLNVSDAVFWFRWLSAVLVAPSAAALIVQNPARRRLFFAAVLIGAVCHLATYGLLTLLGRHGLEAVGLASPRAAQTSVAAHVRITTLAEHPNAAMGMIGLAVPAVLAYGGGLWSRQRLAAAGAGAVVLGFLTTLSRGGLLAGAAAWTAYILVERRWGRRIRPLGLLLAVCLFAGGALVVATTRLEIDTARFAARLDRERLDDNLEGRWETWRRTIDFAATHPMGVGWSTAEELGAFRALTVSHNGYLFMARTLGVLAGLAALGLHLWSAARLDALTPLSVYALAMMMTEDMAQGAGFVFLIALVAALAWRRPVAP